MASARVKGGCLCGAVRFEGALDPQGVEVCHCKQCRRFASGPFISCRFTGGVTLLESRGLKWRDSSEWGKRGFCAECGASLFWAMSDAAEGDWSVSAGALDDDPELEVREHVFEDRRPSYLRLADTAPRTSEAEMFSRLEAYLRRRDAGAEGGADADESR